MLQYNLTLKDFFLFSTLLFFIFSFNLYYEYSKYKSFKATPFLKVEATVLKEYKKFRGKTPYFVLKLKANDFTFYTTTWENLKDIKERKITLKILPTKLKDVTFIDYLRGFYAFSFDIKLLRERSLKYRFSEFLKSQHENEKLKEFFSAIFLGTAISKELREVISGLGISHLIAISGYHLGVLGGILFWILALPYKFFQNRYFPYRNRFIDISFIVFSFLLLYLLLTGFIPSIVRAFVMGVVGFLLLIRAIKVISFANLALAVIVIVAFFPNILFSLGFWFSVAGVFFIFLFLHHFSHLKKYEIFIYIHLFLFIAMLPLSYYFFNQLSLYQLTSPLLTMAFGLFYPIELFLHLFNIGWLFDEVLLKLLNLNIELKSIQISPYFFIFYILLAIGAIFKRWIFYIFCGYILIEISFFN